MRILFLLPVLFCFQSCGSEESSSLLEEKSIIITKVCDLPEEVVETSGILFFKGLLWTINDSGNEPVLYAVDTSSGNVVREVLVVGAENVDWEAIAQDSAYIYIADNGNNYRTRSNYSIYLISKDSITDTMEQEIQPDRIINYYFDDSQLEAVNLTKTNVDSEAILVDSDSIIVYIKDWLYENVTACTFSLTESDVQANIRGSYPLGFAATAVTKFDDNKIAILGYRNFHSYLSIVETNTQFSGEQKLIAAYELVDLEGYQTEGITYENGSFYISCESLVIPQTLFRLEIR